MEWGVRTVALDVRAHLEGLYDFKNYRGTPQDLVYLRLVHDYLDNQDRERMLAYRLQRIVGLSPILKDRKGVVESAQELMADLVEVLFGEKPRSDTSSALSAWEQAFGLKWGSPEFHRFNAQIEMDRAHRLKEAERNKRNGVLPDFG